MSSNIYQNVMFSYATTHIVLTELQATLNIHLHMKARKMLPSKMRKNRQKRMYILKYPADRNVCYTLCCFCSEFEELSILLASPFSTEASSSRPSNR